MKRLLYDRHRFMGWIGHRHDELVMVMIDE